MKGKRARFKFASLGQIVKSLEGIRVSFGAEFSKKREQLLKCKPAFSARLSADLLQRYHEILLFICACPDSANIQRLANSELRRLGAFLSALPAGDATLQGLTASGIEGTFSRECFSHDAWRWLIERCQVSPQFEYEDGSLGDEFDELFALLLRSAGDAVLNCALNSEDLLGLLAGGKENASRWLMQALGREAGQGPVLDQLLSSVNLWLSWRLKGQLGSRTTLRFPKRKPFFHTEQLKPKTAALDIIRQDLPAAEKLSLQQRAHLLDVARGSLLVRSRETDPVTYASLADTHLFRLERGVDVALFGLLPNRRLPIESYVGFVAAKNCVPLAYGGAWVLGPRGEIGVNVFDAFRGADSHFLFSSIMRVYHKFLGVQKFLVQPYQFGDGNKEAIESGAFWFYYRLGFRPTDLILARLAEKESQKIKEIRGYRSSYATLKRFTASKIAMQLVGPTPIDELDVSDIGLEFANQIGRKFGGDVVAAELSCARMLGIAPKEEGSRLAIILLSAKKSLVGQRRQALANIVRAKWGQRETDYVRLLQKETWLVAALANAAAKGRKIAESYS